MIPTNSGTYNVIIVYKGGESIKCDHVRLFEGDWSVQLESEKDMYLINKDEIIFIRAEKAND